MQSDSEWESDPLEEIWDEALAAELLDSVVLIGLTFVDPQDNPVRQEQLWGKVVGVDREAGIQIELRGSNSGDDYWLPPDTRAFQPAAPGEYRLRGTEEVVVNPAYTGLWTITEDVQ
ncbi:MAG: hypothetical protein AB7R90_12495 [Reyranellaceae bacterium]